MLRLRHPVRMAQMAPTVVWGPKGRRAIKESPVPRETKASREPQELMESHPQHREALA